MSMEFFLSVIAGLITSFMIWLSIHVMAPKYRNWRYPAPELNKNWNYYDEFNNSWKEVGSATLTQSGASVALKLHRRINREGTDCEKKFSCTGLYKNGYILLSFTEVGSGGLASGSLVLYLSTDRKSLQGYTVYFDRDEAKVVAFPIKFTPAT